MLKKSIFGVAIIFLITGVIFSLSQPSYSATVVSLEAIGPLSNVAAIQWNILAPVGADVSNFTANFPAGWLDFSAGDTINAFDATGSTSLPTGTVGTFDIDVLLGNWVLGNQSAVTLIEGVDYIVQLDGTNYNIAAVPIPSTIVLLGGALIALAAARRRLSLAVTIVSPNKIRRG